MKAVARPGPATFAVLLLVAAVVPFLIDQRYIISQLTVFFIWATVVSQWNLIFGFGGMFSLAHMAVFAVGGYTVAMLGFYLGLTPWLGLLAGGLAAVLFSVLVGLASLRMRGPYVALLTLAIAQGVYLMIVTDTSCFVEVGCQPFTGGWRGISRFGDFGFDEILGRRNAMIGEYYLALVLLVASVVLCLALLRSPVGYALKALRDNESYAAARGINRFRINLFVFGTAAFLTGVAGGVYAVHFKTIAPNVLSVSLMLYLMSMMIIGGIGSIWGPIAGAAAVMILDEVFRELDISPNIGLGLALILTVIVAPKGIAGLVEMLARRVRNYRSSWKADGSGRRLKASMTE